MVDFIDFSIQLEEIRDGDILCFQRADVPFDRYTLPTVADYFRYN